jgi:hypothetical protein
MKNSRRKSKCAAILVVSFSIFVLSAAICSAQGMIITLENTGPFSITDAGLSFDLKPLDPGQTTDLTVGAGLSLSNIGDFQIGVIPISEDNPLAPGETACVGPLYQLTSGDYVEFVTVDTAGWGITSSPPMGVFKLIPDVTTFPFDVPHDGVQGGRLAGVFRFSSSVPDSCKTGYAPPFGKIEINSGAALSDSTSADISLSCYPTVGYSCQEMQFSNDNINWSAPEPYTRNKTWILLPGDGEKTVYVRFKDSSGNWSNIYSDTIVLRAPTLTQIRSFPIPAFPDPDINIKGLAFGDGKLYAINKFYDRSTQSDKAKIYVLDPANGNILNSFSAPPYVSDLASDGINIYVNTYAPTVGDILKLDPTNGSVLATIHPSGVSITSGINRFIGGLAFLNSDIFQMIATENCGRDSIVRLNTEDGSFLACFNLGSFGFSSGSTHELDSDGTNLLYGTRVKDTVYPGTYFWTVFTLSPSGSPLKSDTILLSQNPDVFSDVFEVWADKQLFVADRRSNQIRVFLLPSTIGVVPTSVNFGQVLVGNALTPQTVTISNPGSANLVIKSIEATGADAGMFGAATGGPNPCPSLTPTIAPGENCTVNVTFSPTSTLKKTAVLKISSAGPDGNPIVNVSLNGTGINTATVITPNGGEIIPSGSTYTVQWGPAFNAADLQYSTNNGSTWKTIASKVPGTSYDWLVPAPANNRTNCLVRVTGFNSSGRKVGKDISDSVFTIEVAKVTWPDGGDTLKSGDTQTITWRATETIRPVASVKLFYSTNGGTSWKAIKTVAGNPGRYDWTVPNVSSSNCKIRVVLKGDGGATVGNDVSDGFFTIQP